ncbi:MAG: hypothetical protein BWZ10_00150 [candidate division BRC1 bacterium ADurb.BinA364]|nr:MAG: hypothetical protein BWZ10_00150 [candidate division BRC1 bacterium ADurb.BinA364]
MRFAIAIHCALAAAWAGLAAPTGWAAGEREMFAIQVVDAATSRGIPLVELKTVNDVRYYTDSAGYAAIDDPGLMGRRVFFHVSSHGYEFAADGFGYRGTKLDVAPGGEARLAMRRLNIAERLYRVTGEGIYRDSQMLGLPAPLAQPVVNGRVAGQDSVQTALYRGRIFWFWGDTNWLEYPLGHFGMSGATSRLPGQGGLDPAEGIDLEYFVNDKGFSRPMCDFPVPGMKWIDGLMVLRDPQGRERLAANYARMKSLGEAYERGLVVYDDEKEGFVHLCDFPLDSMLRPKGQPFRHAADGVEYFYFPGAYPLVRVRADYAAIQNPAAYEGFTCLAAGSRAGDPQPKVERDARGQPVWAYKPGTEPLDEAGQNALIKAGAIAPGDAWLRMRDADSGREIRIHHGSVAYNAYRGRWIMIATESGGESSFLGEIWYAEAEAPEGPWPLGRKIVTHDQYSFYNPAHHTFFDQDGGRIVYFQGTYTMMFSRKADPTPRYDYNQIMYRLDLSDPRLRMD